jgi:hypothetical protein
MVNLLCSPPRGPDGRILYDPYEQTKEFSIELALVAVAILAIQSGLAFKLFRNWVYPAISLMFVLLHPAWTLRWATDQRSGDCGFLQSAGSLSFLVLHALVAAAQCIHGLWLRSRDDPERADYGEPP